MSFLRVGVLRCVIASIISFVSLQRKSAWGTWLRFLSAVAERKQGFRFVKPPRATLIRVAFIWFKSLSCKKITDTRLGIRYFWCARRDLKACYVNQLSIDGLAKTGSVLGLTDLPPTCFWSKLFVEFVSRICR